VATRAPSHREAAAISKKLEALLIGAFMGEIFSESIDVLLIAALAIGGAYRFFSGAKFKDAMQKRKSKKVVE
jgi:hypothetical protein